MKSQFSKVTFLVALAIITVFLSSYINKQETKSNQYLSLKISNQAATAMFIVDENGIVEDIPIGENVWKNLKENTSKITQTINKISKKGYDLFSVSNEPSGVNYIFIKR